MYNLYSYFIFNIEEMEIEPKNLFTKGRLPYFSGLKGKWHVKKLGNNLVVEIYEQGLVETYGSESMTKTIQFDFDLKFSFSKETNEIKFERSKQSCIYGLANVYDLQQWRSILKKKLNQRGFHQQFKPLKKIGKGNFASVYLAQKLEDGLHYAVKAFSKEAAYAEENGKQCLVKEIQIARCLEHPNNMKLYEVFESENSLYIILELLSGGQLYDKVKGKYKFKPQQTRQIIYGILKGLREMHSKGIMHRDLKPENLIFRKQGEWDCVIADYGLAEFSNISHYLFVRCGTPGYVAPEVINIKDMNTKYSPICDIYSLGLIFHVLLLGKSAFSGKTYNEVLAQNRAAHIQFNGDAYDSLQPEALSLMKQMLKKNPHDRISAQKALSHPYFKGMQSEMIEEADDIEIENSPPLSYKNSDYPTLDSPLLTSANAKRKLDKNLKKDSCVQFKMGKENIITGKTEEIETLKSNKISVCATTPLKKPKVSQFCAHPNHK